MAFANPCVLEFHNALMKMSGSVANIIRLAPNTPGEQIRNFRLKIGGCTSFDLRTWFNFWLTKIGCTVMPMSKKKKLKLCICLLTLIAYVSCFEGRRFDLRMTVLRRANVVSLLAFQPFSKKTFSIHLLVLKTHNPLDHMLWIFSCFSQFSVFSI